MTHTAVTPIVNDYTGETSAVLDRHAVTLHDDQADAVVGQDNRGGWYIARAGVIWADTFDWSGTAEHLLLHHLLDDGATLTDPCEYCDGESAWFRGNCFVCDGSGLADSAALAEELDRLYGRPT